MCDSLRIGAAPSVCHSRECPAHPAGAGWRPGRQASAASDHHRSHAGPGGQGWRRGRSAHGLASPADTQGRAVAPISACVRAAEDWTITIAATGITSVHDEPASAERGTASRTSRTWRASAKDGAGSGAGGHRGREVARLVGERVLVPDDTYRVAAGPTCTDGPAAVTRIRVNPCSAAGPVASWNSSPLRRSRSKAAALSDPFDLPAERVLVPRWRTSSPRRTERPLSCRQTAAVASLSPSARPRPGGHRPPCPPSRRRVVRQRSGSAISGCRRPSTSTAAP